jgi:TonB-linked SusC/RagA family outer membrane protein
MIPYDRVGQSLEEDFRNMNGSMRHVGGALLLSIAMMGSAAAQETGRAGGPPQDVNAGLVTGQVVHAVTQRPLAGAQVFIVGIQLGSLTNEEGRFSITGVPAGPRAVRFQLVGYGSMEKPVNVQAGGSIAVAFEVREQVIAIDQVVVTALGIQRGEKSLGYSVQSVRATDFERSPELSFVGALAGQVAGTQVTQSNGQPGGSARLIIRGEGSFRGDGQPLYVIDGMPMTVDIDRNGYDPLARGEAGSRAMDVDPNTIEEISILRGGAATALYGSRAALGAVIIRTKQGTPGAPLRFSVTSRFGQEEPILEGLQTSWAQGVGGFYCNGKPANEGGWCQPGHPGTPDPLANLSWGPHRDSLSSDIIQNGRPRFRDPRSDFYRNGITSTQSLYATGSTPQGTYGMGFSYSNQEGVLTSSKLDRLNLNANLNMNLSPSIKAHTTLLFASTGNDWGWEGAEGLTALVSVLPPTRNLSTAYNEDGTPVMFGSNSPHPQWLAENEYATSSTARWIAAQAIAWNFLPGFTVSNQFGVDSYLDDRQEYVNERPWLTAVGVPNGGTRQQKITRRSVNNDLVVSMDHRPLGAGPFSVSGLVGANIYASSISDVGATGTNLAIPGFYAIGNFTTRLVSANLAAKRRLVGFYTQATFDYKDWAFLTLTGRNDWSSTLPLDDNSYFYPSASLAIAFSDALGWQSRLLDYGKVRLSLSKVGADAPPYRLTSAYVTGAFSDFASGTTTPNNLNFPFRAVRGFVLEDNYGNPDIKPESSVEAELGFELQMFNGRARADISIYNRHSSDQIFSVPVPASTGFKTVLRNAGDLNNRGLELSLGMTPVRSERLHWDVRANVSRNWSSVTDLADGVDYIYLAGAAVGPQIRILPDYSYGVIWGSRYQRNAGGQLIIGADGFPLVDPSPGMLGEILPTWLANLSTSARYRSFGISGLLDIRRGGAILNADLITTIPAGTAKVTEDRNDRYVFNGVSAGSGQRNTTVVVRDQAFWTRYAEVDENLVESGSAVRLREVTATWVLPQRVARLMDMQTLTLFASGRNLKVWAPFSYGDPDGSNYGAVNAGGGAFRLFTVPSTRTYSLGLRASF